MTTDARSGLPIFTDPAETFNPIEFSQALRDAINARQVLVTAGLRADRPPPGVDSRRIYVAIDEMPTYYVDSGPAPVRAGVAPFWRALNLPLNHQYSINEEVVHQPNNHSDHNLGSTYFGSTHLKVTADFAFRTFASGFHQVSVGLKTQVPAGGGITVNVDSQGRDMAYEGPAGLRTTSCTWLLTLGPTTGYTGLVWTYDLGNAAGPVAFKNLTMTAELVGAF